LRLPCRLLGSLLLVIAIATVALIALGAVNGLGLAESLGRLWFEADAGSLNAFQAMVERRLWPPLWDRLVFPVLRQPAVVVAGVSGLAGLLLMVVPRGRRAGRRRLFKR